MKFTFETSAYIRDGKLVVRNRAKVEAEALKSGLTEFEVIVRKKKRYRSIPLNRYYFGIVVVSIRNAFREFGNDVDSELVHEFLKARFHYSEFVDEKSGEIIKLPKSTTEMSNTEFIEYIERIKQFAAETLGIYIADPNEQLELI